MSDVRVQITLPAEVLADLKLRCELKGRDFRRVAGGFIQDALENGFWFDTEEEAAAYDRRRAAGQSGE